MKLNKIASVLVFASSMATYGAHAAADQGAGRVDFKGSIINAACSINPQSTQQEVDLGQIAAKQLANSGTSTPRNFEILLENCDITDDSAVSLTFGGDSANTTNTLLGITGTASGAGIAMTTGNGERITLGQATQPRDLIEGDNTLVFSAYLEGLGGAIETGDFFSSTNFTLAYQ